MSMSQKTLKEFYLDNFITGVYTPTPFIDTQSIAHFDLAEEFADYLGNENVHPFQFVDRDYLCVRYGSLLIAPSFIDYSNDPVPWTIDTDALNVLHSIFFRNAYKWKEYFKTLSYEYNPLWNVDGTTTTEYSEFEIDHDIAQHKLTKSKGPQKTTNTFVAQTVTTTNKNAPVDSATLTTTQQQDVSTPLHADTIGTDAYTDTDTQDAHMDKDIEKEHDVTETRQGNIGVTSTQNLITQQRDIINVSFYDMVFKDIIKEITIPIFR